jgi:hypothetical protein
MYLSLGRARLLHSQSFLFILICLKMSKSLLLSSFDPIEPQKHDRTPQKAGRL